MPRLVSTTQIRVRRSDGRTFPSLAFAYRHLLGTDQALGNSETHRIRETLRAGRTATDSHGFVWEATRIGGRPAHLATTRTTMSSAISSTIHEPDHIAAEISSAILWSDLTFGVELEVITAMAREELQRKVNALGFTGWKVVRDASVPQGWEVVSPILKGERGTQDLTRVMDELVAVGCTVDRTTGMHVHIGVRELPIRALRNICRMYATNERHFDALVAPSRRSANHFCQSVVNADLGALASARTVQGLARTINGGWSTVHYNSYRYRKLNLQSYALHGTFEVRQHAGTVDATKAVAWIRLLTGFVAAAANLRDETQAIAPRSFEDFLTSATDDTSVLQYLEGRRVALSRGAATV